MKIVKNLKGNVVVQEDGAPLGCKNLELDPYFYERQKDLQQTIDDIESGKMPTYDFETSMAELIKELEN